MASFHELTTAQLRQAVQIREQIESLQEKLDTLLGGTSTESFGTSQKPKMGRAKRKTHRFPRESCSDGGSSTGSVCEIEITGR